MDHKQALDRSSEATQGSEKKSEATADGRKLNSIKNLGSNMTTETQVSLNGDARSATKGRQLLEEITQKIIELMDETLKLKELKEHAEHRMQEAKGARHHAWKEHKLADYHYHRARAMKDKSLVRGWKLRQCKFGILRTVKLVLQADREDREVRKAKDGSSVPPRQRVILHSCGHAVWKAVSEGKVGKNKRPVRSTTLAAEVSRKSNDRVSTETAARGAEHGMVTPIPERESPYHCNSVPTKAIPQERATSPESWSSSVEHAGKSSRKGRATAGEATRQKDRLSTSVSKPKDRHKEDLVPSNIVTREKTTTDESTLYSAKVTEKVSNKGSSTAERAARGVQERPFGAVFERETPCSDNPAPSKAVAKEYAVRGEATNTAARPTEKSLTEAQAASGKEATEAETTQDTEIVKEAVVASQIDGNSVSPRMQENPFQLLCGFNVFQVLTFDDTPANDLSSRDDSSNKSTKPRWSWDTLTPGEIDFLISLLHTVFERLPTVVDWVVQETDVSVIRAVEVLKEHRLDLNKTFKALKTRNKPFPVKSSSQARDLELQWSIIELAKCGRRMKILRNLLSGRLLRECESYLNDVLKGTVTCRKHGESSSAGASSERPSPDTFSTSSSSPLRSTSSKHGPYQHYSADRNQSVDLPRHVIPPMYLTKRDIVDALNKNDDDLVKAVNTICNHYKHPPYLVGSTVLKPPRQQSSSEIRHIMQATSATRSEAVKALRSNGNNVVWALHALLHRKRRLILNTGDSHESGDQTDFLV